MVTRNKIETQDHQKNEGTKLWIHIDLQFILDINLLVIYLYFLTLMQILNLFIFLTFDYVHKSCCCNAGSQQPRLKCQRWIWRIINRLKCTLWSGSKNHQPPSTIGILVVGNWNIGGWWFLDPDHKVHIMHKLGSAESCSRLMNQWKQFWSGCRILKDQVYFGEIFADYINHQVDQKSTLRSILHQLCVSNWKSLGY